MSIIGLQLLRLALQRWYRKAILGVEGSTEVEGDLEANDCKYELPKSIGATLLLTGAKPVLGS